MEGDFLLEKSFVFEAMHVLTNHDGKCARPHGHSYGLTVAVALPSLQMDGCKKNMAMDFSDISAKVRPIIDGFLDHHNLNDTLQTDSPTAEFIAAWIFQRLHGQLPELESVCVRETATSSVTLRRRRRQPSTDAHYGPPSSHTPKDRLSELENGKSGSVTHRKDHCANAHSAVDVRDAQQSIGDHRARGGSPELPQSTPVVFQGATLRQSEQR